MTKFKDKERILKAARKKQEVTHKGELIRLLADFSTESQKEMARNFPRIEKERPITKSTVPSKVLNYNGRQKKGVSMTKEG